MNSEMFLETNLAASRLAVYRFLLNSLEKPSRDQHRWMLGADFRQALALLCVQFELEMPAGDLVPESYPDFESRYLRCFEVGLPEAPVVLQASHYIRNEPAPKIVHEHVLFYRHFHSAPTTQTGESADHLLNELLFLIHLDALAQEGHPDQESLARARGDFLDRHLNRWTPRAAERAAERGLPDLYTALLTLLAVAVREDRDLVSGSVPLGLEVRPS